MQDLRVAKRYAQALFTIALKNDVVTSVESDLDAIVGLLHNDAGFKDFLFSPYVSREDKVQISEKLFSDRVTILTMYLLRLLLAKRRELELEGIREEFASLRRGHSKAVHVTITSAEELSADHQKQLIAKAAKMSGRDVEPDFVVEPALIAGVKVEFENLVVDGTVRGNLMKLRENLRANVFHNA